MITPYSAALFIHVAGAVTLFAAIGIEWIYTLLMRKTDNIISMKQLIRSVSKIQQIHGPAWLFILASGIYLTAISWHMQDWIASALVLIAVMIVLGGVLTGKRLSPLVKEINKSNALTDEIQKKLKDKIFLYSLSLRTAIAMEIVFLMTIKPQYPIAIISFLLAALIGFTAVYLNKNQSVDLANQLENNQL